MFLSSGCLIKTLAPFALNTTEWNDLKPRLKISDKEEDEMMRDMTRIGVSRSLHLVLMKRFEHDQPHYSTVENLKALVEKLQEFVSTHGNGLSTVHVMYNVVSKSINFL